VVQGLLFDWIEAEARRAAVGREDHLVTGTRPHEAKPALALVQLALSRAKIALDAAVREGMPIAAGHSATCVIVFHEMKMRWS
jgi:hypothetical protein